MNMSAQRDRHVAGQVGCADYIGAEAEGEVARTARGPFDALVEAQHPDVGWEHVACRGSEDLAKATADLTRVRDPDERGADAARLEHDAAGSIEDVQALVQRQQGIGHPRPFVVSRDEQDRHAGRREALQWRECRFGQPGRHAAPIQQVAPVHHRVDIAGARGLEGPLEVPEEVIAAPAAGDARARRHVEAEMRVGHEQHAHVTPRTGHGPGARRRARARRRIGRQRGRRRQPDA
jgi:hypothetical protein